MAKKIKRYTMAENMLVENLQILNEKPFAGPADLIWELNPRAIKHSKKLYKPAFITAAGISLHEEAKKQNNINFVLSDKLRNIDLILADLTFEFHATQKDPKFQKKSVLELHNYLQATIDNGKEFVEQAKSKLKQQPEAFKKLTTIWESIALCLTNIKIYLQSLYDKDL